MVYLTIWDYNANRNNIYIPACRQYFVENATIF